MKIAHVNKLPKTVVETIKACIKNDLYSKLITYLLTLSDVDLNNPEYMPYSRKNPNLKENWLFYAINSEKSNDHFIHILIKHGNLNMAAIDTCGYTFLQRYVREQKLSEDLVQLVLDKLNTTIPAAVFNELIPTRANNKNIISTMLLTHNAKYIALEIPMERASVNISLEIDIDIINEELRSTTPWPNMQTSEFNWDWLGESSENYFNDDDSNTEDDINIEAPKSITPNIIYDLPIPPLSDSCTDNKINDTSILNKHQRLTEEKVGPEMFWQFHPNDRDPEINTQYNMTLEVYNCIKEINYAKANEPEKIIFHLQNFLYNSSAYDEIDITQLLMHTFKTLTSMPYEKFDKERVFNIVNNLVTFIEQNVKETYQAKKQIINLISSITTRVNSETVYFRSKDRAKISVDLRAKLDEETDPVTFYEPLLRSKSGRIIKPVMEISLHTDKSGKKYTYRNCNANNYI